MKAYSLDLRERVIALIQAGELSQPQIAEQFHISLGTVENWWRRWRETGTLAPHPFAGGAPRTLAACAAVIRAAIAQQPDATLTELCDQVRTKAGIRATRSMMCRELQILKLPRKKSLHDSQRDTPRVRLAASVSKRPPRPVAPSRRTTQIHR